MRFLVATLLFVIGAAIIATNQPTLEILITGMFFICISIIATTFMIHFPSENPEKRPVKRKK